MAKTKIASYGCHTWFNWPEVSVSGRYAYIGTFSAPAGSASRIEILQINLAGKNELVTNQLNTYSGGNHTQEDHTNPAVLVLNSGKILAAWCENGGDSWCQTTTNAHDIRTWGSRVSVNSGSPTNSYCVLHQTPNGRIYWFYNVVGSGNHRTWTYRTSDDEGATWSAGVSMFNVASNRIYRVYCRENANKLHVLMNRIAPEDGDNTDVYHGTINFTGNTVTVHQSDGTLVGGVADFPLDPNELTLVDAFADDRRQWVWDIQYVNGAPYGVFAKFGAAEDNTAHEYFQCRWSGSAWSVESICTAGTTATDDGISATSPRYSPGIAQSAVDEDEVCLSREYGSGDFRMEIWRRISEGTWIKVQDLSGDTSSTNARPIAFAHDGLPYYIWWEGSYTNYTTFETAIWLSEALSYRSAKPIVPVLRAPFVHPGSQVVLPFQELSGTAVDLLGNETFTQVGTVPRDADSVGLYAGPFSTSNYLTCDAFAPDWNPDTFPKWVAVLFRNSNSATGQRLLSFGHSSGSGWYDLTVNANTAGTLQWRARNDAATNATVSVGSQPLNDGELHVAMAIEFGSANRAIYLDGEPVASDTTSTAAPRTLNQFSIGVLRTSSVSNPFLGDIYALAVGMGECPSPADLYLDWINGRFAGMAGDNDYTTLTTTGQLIGGPLVGSQLIG